MTTSAVVDPHKLSPPESSLLLATVPITYVSDCESDCESVYRWITKENMKQIKYCSLAESHHKVYIVCILICSFFSNVLVGSIYTFGNIQPYLVSYIRLQSQPSSLRYTESTYLYSTQYAGHAIGSALGGLMESKIGARLSYIFGGLVATVGLLSSYFSIHYSFWLLFLTYGVMYSLGIGVMYFVTIKCATIWLPKRAGLGVGIVIGGAGLGGLVFGALQTGFINRSNLFPNQSPYIKYPDEKYYTQTELIDNVPFIFLIQSAIFGLIIVISSFIIANPQFLQVIDRPEASINHSFLKNSRSEVINRKIRQLKQAFVALSKIQCYLLWVINLDSILATGVISSLYETYGLEVLQSSDYFLTALGGIGYGVASIAGRVSFGYLADKIGYKPAFVLLTGMMAVFFSTLYITSLGYPVMYFIWICGIFLCYGGHNTLIVLMVLNSFGDKHLFVNYTIVDTSSQAIAGFLFGFVSDFCVDHFNWSGTFVLLGIIVTTQFIFVLFLSENKNKPSSERQNIEESF